MDMQKHFQNTKKHSVIKFLFPLYPHHIFKSTKLMALIGTLIALRFIIGMFSITIPGVSISISITWVTDMLMGWIYGPIYGFVLGAICDTIGYIASPTAVWFWMFAIQEPMVGFLSGVFGSFCAWRCVYKKNYLIDLLIQQIVIISFVAISLISILIWVDDKSIKLFNIYKWIVISMITIYLTVMEIFTYLNIKSIYDQKERTLIFIYSTTLVMVAMIICSFLLGPISAIEYLKHINGEYPESYMKYGTIFYLIPRVAKESIKSPLESIALTSLIIITKPMIETYINELQNKWVIF